MHLQTSEPRTTNNTKYGRQDHAVQSGRRATRSWKVERQRFSGARSHLARGRQRVGRRAGGLGTPAADLELA